MNLDWLARGLCRDVDPEIFFESTDKAKAICAQCPVQPKCLSWSLDTWPRYGVFGGLSEDEREERIHPKHKTKTIRQCINCGTKFMPVNRNQRNCSAKCRKERERELDKESRLIRRSKSTFKHGRAGYQLGCRCEICVTNEHEYLKGWRKQRKEKKAG